MKKFPIQSGAKNPNSRLRQAVTGKEMEVKLKKVPAKNKGLKKLPTKVRNKMGFMKKGGKVKPAMKYGGVLKVASKKSKKKRCNT